MYLGVDVGGSKTDAVLCTAQGDIVARHQYGPGNWESIGLDAAAMTYAEIVRDMTSRAQIQPHAIQASAWGLAGLDWPSDEVRLNAIVQPLLPGVPLVLVNDAFLPLRAGARFGYGVGVIAGTGSTVAGIAVDGRRFRNFGLGSQWGGFDGAAHLGYAAMRMAADAYFGRRPATALSTALCAWAGVDSIPVLAERCSRGEFACNPGDFAPQVVQIALAGDPAAIQIIDEAAALLADNALAIMQHLDLQRVDCDVVLAGGFATGATPQFYTRLLQDIRREAPQAQLVTLAYRPVLGAVLLAMDVHQACTAPVLNRLQMQLRDA